MSNKNSADPRALKILLRYDIIAELASEGTENLARRVLGRPTSPEDFQYMVDNGIAFPKVSMTHDEAIDACFDGFHAEDRKKFSNLFVSGLGSNRPDWRSGLGAYALMQSMPKHRFQPNLAGVCEICSAHANYDRLDLTYLNQIRFAVGGFVLAMRPYEIQFFLAQQNKLHDEQPTANDWQCLQAVLDIARHADQSATPIGLQKLIKKMTKPKLTNDQIRSLIDCLGLCGILQTEKHKGYLDHFTNPGLAPHKTRSSDWAYPVDFWTGKDGVNEDAVDFWFGHLA